MVRKLWKGRDWFELSIIYSSFGISRFSSIFFAVFIGFSTKEKPQMQFWSNQPGYRWIISYDKIFNTFLVLLP